MNNLQSVVV